jgi:hypothetical protein
MSIGTKLLAAALALLAVTAAQAQPDPVLTADYVDAHRPQVAKRSLSGAEKARARELVRQIEAAPSEVLLDELRPLANSGDVALMTAMWKGYGKVNLYKRVEDEPGGFRLGTALQAQWAIQLWRAGEQSREVALSLSNCFGPTYGNRTFHPVRECGYEAQASEKTIKRLDNFGGYHDKLDGKPEATFIERRPELGPGWARRRFERIVSTVHARGPRPGWFDIQFANAYAQNVVPTLYPFWKDVRDLDDTSVDRTRRIALGKARADQLRTWLDFGERRRAPGGLSEADRNAWFKLSALLGANNLAGYASLYPLAEAWQVEAVCAYTATGPAQTTCKVQRGLLAQRVSGIATGPTVPVQSYDVAGNPTRIVAIPRSAFELFQR